MTADSKIYVGEERRQMPDPSAMAFKLERIQTDVDKLNSSLQTLTDSINKLAVFEERQSHLHAENQRALSRIDSIDSRLRTLESQVVSNTRQSNESSKWISHAITGIISAGCVYFAAQIGVLVP